MKIQNFIKMLFITTSLVVFVLAVLPASKMPDLQSWDKLNHFMAFFVLTILFVFGFRARYLVAFVSLLLFGIFIEIAQYFSINRSSEMLDVAADTVGIFSAIGLIWIYRFLVIKNHKTIFFSDIIAKNFKGD